MPRELHASGIPVFGVVRLNFVGKFRTVLLQAYPLRQIHSNHQKTLAIVISELWISDFRCELQRVSSLAIDPSQSDQFDSCVTLVESRFDQGKPVFFQDIHGDPVDSQPSPGVMIGKRCSSIVTDRRLAMTYHEKLKNISCRCTVIEIKVPTTVESRDAKAPVGIDCL